MWPVKYGQPYANEIERWMYSNLLAALLERIDELRSLGWEDPFEELALTKRFSTLSSDERLTAICESAIALMDPLAPVSGQSAILAEAGAIPFEGLKTLIGFEIELERETDVSDSSDRFCFWRCKTLLFFYGLHGPRLTNMVEEDLLEEAREHGDLSEADIQACATQAQEILNNGTYLDFLPEVPKSPQESDIEVWKELIENYLMDDRLFQDRDWYMNLPSSHPELTDAAVLDLQLKNQEIQETIGIAIDYFDVSLSKHRLNQSQNLRRDVEKYWIAPHIQTPAIVHRIVVALGQEHLLVACQSDESIGNERLAGSPKKVQNLLEKTTFREGCHLALKIPYPDGHFRVIPVTEISILETEAVYGIGGNICEFETEEGANAMEDLLNPENIEEVVVFDVMELSSCFRSVDDVPK